MSETSKGSACPQCSNSRVCEHNCLAIWLPCLQLTGTMNGDFPSSVLVHSQHMVSWHCDVCSHKWSATPHSRVSHLAAGCSQCNARGKAKAKQPTFAECQHPLLAEWDQQRNAAQESFPCNTSLHSHKDTLWLCPKCPAGQQHIWSARPHHCTGAKESHCPFCAWKGACGCNSLQVLDPEIAAEWDRRMGAQEEQRAAL